MKKLPLTKEPIINCFNDESFTFNIVSQKDSFEDWILSNYINICMENKFYIFNRPILSWREFPYYIPGVEENRMTRQFFFQNYITPQYIIKYLESAILNDYYVYLFLNEFFISGKPSYMKTNYTHDSLLYGCDEELQIFYLYSYNDKGKLDFFKISYSNFLKAFMELDDDHQQKSDISFFRANESDYIYDTETVKKKLELYFNGTVIPIDNREYFKENFSFGIDIYMNLVNYYSFEHKEIDIKIPHKLLEHKIWLKKVIENYCLKINEPFGEELEESLSIIITESSILKALSLKYNLESSLQRKKKIIQKCIKKIDKLYEIEITIKLRLLGE